MARSDLDALRDQLYMLRCAAEDVRRDLAASATRQDYADAVAWLLEACSPLIVDRNP